MLNATAYQTCIQACLDCAMTCEACASACLQEQDVKMMARCITLDRECADLCLLAARLMARGAENAQAFCRLCADTCRACGEECGKHEAEHCQACSRACLACAEECARMAA